MTQGEASENIDTPFMMSLRDYGLRLESTDGIGTSTTSVRGWCSFFSWFVCCRRALKGRHDTTMTRKHAPSMTGGGANPRKGKVEGVLEGDWDKK